MLRLGDSPIDFNFGERKNALMLATSTHWIFTLLLLMPPLPAQAATTLTWNDCVQRLKRENAELLALEANLEASQFRETVAESGYWPHIFANLGASRGVNVDRPESAGTGYAAVLKLEHNLFTGFADRARVRQAEATTTSTKADLVALKARLSRDLKVAVENFQFANRQIVLQRDILRRREGNVRMVGLRFQGGRENRGALLVSQAALAEAKFDELQSTFTLRAARTDLARLLGLEPSEDLEVTDEVPSKPAPTLEALSGLVDRTPIVQSAMAQEEMAQAGVTIARSAFSPNLSWYAELKGEDNSFFPRENTNLGVGVNLTFPLFDGGRDLASTRAAGRVLLAAVQNRVRVQRNTTVDLENSLIAFIRASEKVKVDSAFLEALTIRAEIARRKYENGLMSFDDWDAIENDLIARQRNSISGVHDRAIAEAAWEQTQGKGVLP